MICIPLKQKSFSTLLKKIPLAQKEGDIIEVWFDELTQISPEKLQKIFKIKKKPFLYKCLNHQNLPAVLKHEVEYLDLDLESTSPQTIKQARELSPKTKIILSHHDFKETPSDTKIKKIVQKALKKGADIVKIANTATSKSDSFRMLHQLEELVASGTQGIFICMGKEGKITRLTGHLFGNLLMYAPLDAKNKTAPGQVTVKELKAAQALTK